MRPTAIYDLAQRMAEWVHPALIKVEGGFPVLVADGRVPLDAEQQAYLFGLLITELVEAYEQRDVAEQRLSRLESTLDEVKDWVEEEQLRRARRSTCEEFLDELE